MSKVQISVYQKEKPGSPFCGDRYFYEETESGFICALADGLGTGEFAEESAEIVIDIIKNNPEATPNEIMITCNKQLHGKRGVVLGILKLDFITNIYTVSTIGNIGIVFIHNKKKQHHIPTGGYLAGTKKKFKVEHGQLKDDMHFIMYSDGVSDADLNPCIMHEDVREIISAYDEATKLRERRDDTTLLAIRYKK